MSALPLVALLGAAALWQQQPGERYGLVSVRGADTTALERVVREGRTLRAEVLVPRRVRLTVAAATDAFGCANEVEVRVFPWGSAADATPLQRVSARLDGDSVRVAVAARGVERSVALAAPGARALLTDESVAAALLVLECARSVGGDSADVPALVFPGRSGLTVRVRRHGDSVLVVTSDSSWVRLDGAGRFSSIAIGSGGTVVRRVPAQALDQVALAAPDYSAPAGAPYRAIEAVVPAADGARLVGTLTVPSGASGRVPAVVTISGSGADDRDESAPIAGGYRPFREIADTLSRRGVAVLRLDDRGVGSSSGDFANATERTLAADVRSALAWLRARPDIAPDRLMVLGHSEGARVAMLVAEAEEQLAGVILMAGAAEPRAALVAQVRRQLPDSLPPAVRDSVLRAYGRQLDSLAPRIGREVLRWDAAALARGIRAPVAVFQGGTDTQVPPDQAERLGDILRRAGNRDVTVRIFPERNHLFVRDPDGDFRRYDRLQDARLAEDVRGAIVDWVLARAGIGST